MVPKSRVTWATSVPILVFIGLYVLDLGPMYTIDRQTDRQTDVRQHRRLMRLVSDGITSCKRAATTISPAQTCSGSAQRQHTANNFSKKL